MHDLYLLVLMSLYPPRQDLAEYIQVNKRFLLPGRDGWKQHVGLA